MPKFTDGTFKMLLRFLQDLGYSQHAAEQIDCDTIEITLQKLQYPIALNEQDVVAFGQDDVFVSLSLLKCLQWTITLIKCHDEIDQDDLLFPVAQLINNEDSYRLYNKRAVYEFCVETLPINDRQKVDDLFETYNSALVAVDPYTPKTLSGALDELTDDFYRYLRNLPEAAEICDRMDYMIYITKNDNNKRKHKLQIMEEEIERIENDTNERMKQYRMELDDVISRYQLFFRVEELPVINPMLLNEELKELKERLQSENSELEKKEKEFNIFIYEAAREIGLHLVLVQVNCCLFSPFLSPIIKIFAQHPNRPQSFKMEDYLFYQNGR
ncbi:uncharacterized protein TRIADDRAFT_61955 [Trichoplax adhaerens]|uniref:Uncharacterized protein n=1 Tax=Trichoplax adhaerens TaxID=10228 RepID=B3SCF7_TRIAD|nr:predicted protein [Trichoplax adhaerens]EDV19608.1 predicted protein [Trichoplax adhaerens]|eukprot:XP_002117941.1 predicted protein [Trichoplax adhaerens]